MDKFVCIAWGSLEDAGHHEGCPVLFRSASEAERFPQHPLIERYPVVCPCDCVDCRRVWWRMGRPILRDGKIVVDGEA